jgi:hypothetical protein
MSGRYEREAFKTTLFSTHHTLLSKIVVWQLSCHDLYVLDSCVLLRRLAGTTAALPWVALRMENLILLRVVFHSLWQSAMPAACI